MDKVNEILNNNIYKENLLLINEFEKDRKFCKHNLEHFLDVSRIAYILCLEEKVDISKEIIYSIGLLHDIGRALEYKDNIPHHKGSVIISELIFKEIEFTTDEKNIILSVIESHRNHKSLSEINSIFYKADKLSRNCLNCFAQSECYWSLEKKNLTLNY